MMTKISPAQAIIIRSFLKSGDATICELAQAYEVSYNTIWKIKSRTTHVAYDGSDKSPFKPVYLRKMTPEQVDEMVKLWPEENTTELGQRYGVSRQAIHLILKKMGVA
jgi:Mor family transcriptional regulator